MSLVQVGVPNDSAGLVLPLHLHLSSTYCLLYRATMKCCTCHTALPAGQQCMFCPWCGVRQNTSGDNSIMMTSSLTISHSLSLQISPNLSRSLPLSPYLPISISPSGNFTDYNIVCRLYRTKQANQNTCRVAETDER